MSYADLPYRVSSQKSTQEAARYALVTTLMAALNYAAYLVLLGLSFFAYRRFVFNLPR